MKRIFLNLIIPLTVFQVCRSQSSENISHKSNFIDSIQTAKQLSDFIIKVDKGFKDFKINESLKFETKYSSKNFQKIADSLQVKPWVKADFDNNGLTDILVIGTMQDEHRIICILDKGNKYEVKGITRSNFQKPTFPRVKDNKINYYFESERDPMDWHKPTTMKEVTLIYKFDDFVEENEKPASHKIEKIEYATTECFGSCPIFKMIINADRTSKWSAISENEIDEKRVVGDFQTIISKEKYDELINLLNYIDFATLKDNYAVSWTDDQTSTLTITYDGGKIKSIKDYGLLGSFGLERVYQMLFRLRENQKWNK